MEWNVQTCILTPEQPLPKACETFDVSGDVTLPGSLREAAQVLYADAAVAVESAEPSKDRVTLRGRVTFRVLYAQGDPQRIDAIEATADFTRLCDLPGATAHASVNPIARVKGVDSSVSGGRMNLTAHVEACLNATLCEPVEVITEIPGSQVQRKNAQVTLHKTSARGTEDALLREEFALPAELNIRETLFARANAGSVTATGGQGRIGLSGEITLEVLHLSDLPGKPIVTTRHTIPVNQGVSISREAGEMLDGCIAVKDVAVASQLTEEGPILRAEVLIALEAWADETQQAQLMTDAYTTSGDDLRLTKTPLTVRTGTEQTAAAESWKAAFLLPEGAKPLRTVLAAFLTPEASAFTRQGSRTNVEGAADATLVYLADDGSVTSAKAALPLRAAFAASFQPEDDVALEAVQVEAVPITSDRAEMRCVLNLTANGQRTETVPFVTAASAEAGEAPSPDILLVFVQPGENAWDVAKRYRIGQSRLQALNPGMNEGVKPGQGLVIWRKAE